MTFTAAITTERNSGWTCVVVPDSGYIFGTRRAVKVDGTVDGHPVRTTLLPIGDGTHMLPLRAAVRTVVDKSLGEDVTVHLQRRPG
jgi:hypothetical protein